MTMHDAVRRGLTRMQKLAHDEQERRSEDTLEERCGTYDDLDAAISWVDAQLAADDRAHLAERRSRERSIAGLCSRCGSNDPQCICYAR